MNQHRIVIDPSNPEHVLDAALAVEDGGHSFIHGRGIRKNNEMSDYVVNKGDIIPLHTHDYGYELFYVMKGKVTAFVGGYRSVAGPGDMLLIQPHTPHGFEYREDTLWWEMLSELCMWDDVWSIDRIFENCPDLFFKDQEFNGRFMRGKGQIDYPEYPVSGMTEVKPEQLPGFLRKGTYYRKYSLPGVECRLKYPKWDLNGLKEIWEFVLDKNVCMEFGKHCFSEEFMVVTEGSVRVEVQREEPQTAAKGQIINIPNYTAHKLTAPEHGTVLQDFNVQFDLFLMLDEIDAYRRSDPERVDEDYLLETFLKYECPCTEIGGLIKI